MPRLYQLPPLQYDFFEKEESKNRIIYKFVYTLDELHKIKNYLNDFNDNPTIRFINELLEILFKQESILDNEMSILNFSKEELNKEEKTSLNENQINEILSPLLKKLTQGKEQLITLNEENKGNEFTLLSGALVYSRHHIEKYIEGTLQNAPHYFKEFANILNQLCSENIIRNIRN